MADIRAARDELVQLGFDVDGLDAGARAMYDSLTDEEVGSLCAIVRDLAGDDVTGYGMRGRGRSVTEIPAEHLEAVSENVRALARLYVAQQDDRSAPS